MKLEKCVNELLYHYDCVTIPGFGSFLATDSKGLKNMESTVLYPKRRNISFNINLDHNDGLLIHHISGKANLDYKSSKDFVETEVLIWQKKLSDKGVLSLSGIGKFEKKEDVLEFKPFEFESYLKASYGLPSLELSNISEVKKGGWLRYFKTISKVASVCLVFISLGFYATKYQARKAPELANSSIVPVDNFTNKDDCSTSLTVDTTDCLWEINSTSSEISKEEIVSVSKEDLNKKKVSILDKKSILVQKELNKDSVILAEAKKKKDLLALKEKEAKESEDAAAVLDLKIYKYQIVGGAFGSKKNANKFISELKSRGFNRAMITGKAGKLYIVSLDSYASYAEAYELLVEVRTVYKKAWIKH